MGCKTAEETTYSLMITAYKKQVDKQQYSIAIVIFPHWLPVKLFYFMRESELKKSSLYLNFPISISVCVCK